MDVATSTYVFNFQVTLRYLATGQSLTSLHYEWNISVATLSNLVMEVCESILRNLRSRWLITPQTEAEWTEISLGLDRWNYPNCLGWFTNLL